jgi:hypothetical protein
LLKKDAAAHKKEQESLSPEDKVQLLNKDAASHKKQQESLSPDDKVQLLKRMLCCTHKTPRVSLS